MNSFDQDPKKILNRFLGQFKREESQTEPPSESYGPIRFQSKSALLYNYQIHHSPQQMAIQVEMQKQKQKMMQMLHPLQRRLQKQQAQLAQAYSQTPTISPSPSQIGPSQPQQRLMLIRTLIQQMRNQNQNQNQSPNQNPTQPPNRPQNENRTNQER